MAIVRNVRGPIIKNNHKWIYDLFEMDAICPNDISKAIQEAKESNDTLVLKINSPGGLCDAGGEMYEEIKSSDVYVEARIVGECCSAATFLTCAANRATMSPVSEFMIHRCAIGGASGNVNDFKNYIEMMDEQDKGIALAYTLKTGKSQEEIIKMMDKTTWLSAEKALEHGFIDEILFVDSIPSGTQLLNLGSMENHIVNANDHLISEEIINEMMENKEEYFKKLNNRADQELQLAEARLNLLELGGI